MTDPGLTPQEEQRLRSALDALPERIEPARDLFPEIRARIDATRVRPISASAAAAQAHALATMATARAPRRRPWVGLAAAAVLLVFASVSLTWLAMRGREAQATLAASVARDRGVPVDTPDGPPTAGALASFASYERSAADLAAALEQRSAKLDPATRAVLERSLRTIDEALTEARAALAADPASAAFHSFVESAYRQKLDFLRRANDIAALQGA